MSRDFLGVGVFLPDVFRRLFEPGGPLDRFEAATLEGEAAVVYALDPDGRYLYCNPSWDVFAHENGGNGLGRLMMPGRSLYDDLPEALASFYWNRYDQVLETAKPWEFDVERSSPDRFRPLRMRAIPLDRRSGILVMNFTVLERAHDGDCEPAPRGGTEPTPMTMCASCRRILRSSRDGTEWVWSRTALCGDQGAFTHDLCPVCLEHHFGREMVRQLKEPALQAPAVLPETG